MSFKYRLILQYDGTEYFGWQFQIEQPTIQGTLEAKLKQILSHPVRLYGAGRTDAGVHAHHQVAHFIYPRKLDPYRVRRSLNAVLPRDIRVSLMERVPHNFHARFSSIWKEYVYTIYNGETVPPHLERYVWHIRHPLDYGEMVKGARLFEGTYNFIVFGKGLKEGDTAIRTILWAGWEMTPPFLRFRIASRGFLRGMVRYIVGSLIDVGQRRLDLGTLAKMISGEYYPERITKAPPHGLSLFYVAYPPDVFFEVPKT